MGLYLGGDEVSQKISTVTIGSTLPDQTDNAGKFLTTDGEQPSWSNVENEIYWVDTEDENVYDKVTEAINSNKLVMTNYNGKVYYLHGQHSGENAPYIFSSSSVDTLSGFNLHPSGAVQTYWKLTQDLLESGENIKTINGESILGSGDLEIKSSGSGRNVGDIFYTTRTDNELNGAVECNGGTYNIGDFEGNQSVGVLLNSGSLPYVSLAEYASIVSTNGSCRAFGWDGGDTFRVPTLQDVYIEAGTASSAGEFISESLPNVSGGVGACTVIDNTSNPFYTSGTSSKGSSQDGTDELVYMDLSRSSSTYKNGAKVKPDSVRYRAMVQLANSVTDEALIASTSVLQQLANKVSKSGDETINGFKTFLDNIEVRGENEPYILLHTPGKFYGRLCMTESGMASKKGDGSALQHFYAGASDILNSVVTTLSINKSSNAIGLKLGNGIIINSLILNSQNTTYTWKIPFTTTEYVVVTTSCSGLKNFTRTTTTISCNDFNHGESSKPSDVMAIAIGY